MSSRLNDDTTPYHYSNKRRAATFNNTAGCILSPKALLVCLVFSISQSSAFLTSTPPRIALTTGTTTTTATTTATTTTKNDKDLPPLRGCRPRSSRSIILSATPPSSSSPSSPAKKNKTAKKKPQQQQQQQQTQSPKKPPKGASLVKFGGGRVTTKIGEASAKESSEAPRGRQPQGGDEDEQDVRKTARWGVKPPPSKPTGQLARGLGAGLGKPFGLVGSSLSAIGQGLTATKDAVYGAVDAAGSIAEQLDGDNKGPNSSTATTASAKGSPLAASNEASPGVASGSGGNSGRVTRALHALGGAAVITKDVFWGSVEVIGSAVDAAKNAPETVRTVAQDGKAVIEGAKGNVEAAIRAPGIALDTVSSAVDGFVGGVGKAASSAKEGAYSAVDFVSRLASAPADMAKKRSREQEESDERAAEALAKRRAAAGKVEAVVSSAKSAVWGTVEGVETLVETVAATPAAVGGGFGKAKEAVNSAGELLETIPRTVQEIPREAQKKVDGVLESVASTQDAAARLVSGLKGGLAGVTKLVKVVSGIVTGKAKQEREERERAEAERKLEEKKKKALLTVKGQPYTAGDLAVSAVGSIGATAKGAVSVGKGLVNAASKVKSAPSEAARFFFGPFYKYQQSQKRVQEAVRLSVETDATPSPPLSKPTAASPARSTAVSSKSSTAVSSESPPAVSLESSTVVSSEASTAVPLGSSTAAAAAVSPAETSETSGKTPEVGKPQEGAGPSWGSDKGDSRPDWSKSSFRNKK